jgi:Ca2+-binding RTX toxin-like protein
MSFAASPAVLEADGSGGWTSTESQSLLVQIASDSLTTAIVSSGSESASIVSLPSAAFAWTSRFAQQALQSDFDSKLVKLFDKQSQGALTSISTATGDDFAVTIDAQSALAPQGTLTAPFGFVDFVSGESDVRVARPVAVAKTVDALDDQQAVIRMRQVGHEKLVIKFYRVDDFAGSIDGLAPGDAGYAAAADARAYATTAGATSIKGPGYGKYGEAILVGVDAGDLIAMKLTQGKKTFWAFASANETVDGVSVGHLWNYGLNTWGWESTYGGGDRDFNDLVVQLDFTSGYGEITGTDDVLKGGKGNVTLSGLGGSDTLKGGSGDEILLGGKGGDVLTGGAGADTLNGDDGNDRLDGGKGIDTLNGGEGDDILQVRDKEGAYDTFNGDTGTDTLQLIGTVTLAGFDATASSIEKLQGSGRGLYGTDQADVFDLSGLTDALAGLRFIDGKGGSDILIGSSFADDLRGGKGDDTLDGRGGNDMLDGGKGLNTFVFADGYDNDRIVKFQAGTDTVDLTGVAGVNDFSELQALMQQDGKNVLIDFGSGDTLTLQKTTIATLTANQGDFLFA